MDQIVDDLALGHVQLISITTNGAEEEILRVVEATIRRDMPYVALARTGNTQVDFMRRLNYRLMGEDDRGSTFCPALT